MKTPTPVTIDFETEAALRRPFYPPVPVGVAIKVGGKPAHYYAWGHPTGNNCTKAEAVAALKAVWDCPDGLLFHNAKFDIDVAEVHLKLKPPPPEKIHDTMFLLFLHNPHMKRLALKPASEELLGLPPDERDAVFDWLVEHKIVASNARKKAGAFICKAPGDLVGTYAVGDVDRTWGLFKLLHKDIVKRKMLVAYQREQNLMPCLLDMERHGVRVDLDRLRHDASVYGQLLSKIEGWILHRLKVKSLNLDSGEALMQGLIDAGKIDLTKVERTKKGEYKTDKDTFAAAITDPTLKSVLRYHGALATCVRTFMQPWLTTAEASGGRIFCEWNQLRSYSPRGRTEGAVTGRLSSSPNLQNIPNEFKPLFKHDTEDKAERAALPKSPFPMPPLPRVRSYIMADDGHILIDRDYSQQELRILAHYEDGDLLSSYLANVWMDVHDTVRQEVNGLLHTEFKRKVIKTVNFGLIYGMGVGLLAQRADCSVAEAKSVKKAVLATYPGIRALMDDLKERAANNQPLRTWGGREYFCEAPRIVDGQVRTFDYKMLNTLVQGSAADCTKEAVIRYYKVKPKGHRLLLTVHDELLVSLPAKQAPTGMGVLQAAMESVEFDLPILSEGDISATNWADMTAYDEKGKCVGNPTIL